MGGVLILHGWQNHRPEGHWQRWLAGELTARGHDVRYPQLPDADAPTRADWLAALDAELAGTNPADLTVVAHSLGCSLWLAHALARAEAGLGAPVAARVVLVAPPSEGFLAGIPEIAEFAAGASDDATRERVGAALAAATTAAPLVVQSDDDPCSPAGTLGLADALGLERITVAGAGHFTIEEGFGPLPVVLDLVDGTGAHGTGTGAGTGAETETAA